MPPVAVRTISVIFKHLGPEVSLVSTVILPAGSILIEYFIKKWVGVGRLEKSGLG